MNRFLATGVFLAIATCALASNSFDSPLASPPGVYFGSGNANSNFTVSTVQCRCTTSNELGLSIILRHVGPIDPGAGSNTYDVPAGVGGGDALWNWDFSINTDVSTAGTFTLSDFTYALTIEDLTTLSNNGAGFDPTLIPDDSEFGSGGKTSGAALNTVYGSQNSENLSFSLISIPGFDPNATDLYQFTLTESQAGGVVNSVTAFAQVTPEPGTFGVIGAGFVVVGLIARRRQAKRRIV